VLLSVVVPVYNGGDEIIENVEVIRCRVAAGLPGEELEIVVVSDGSIDGTAERLIESRAGAENVRVLHYDRNLGKGYAVKAGALASHGDWIALVDADLDLDPSSIPAYLDVARRESLDFAIGSKRHPDSVVHYPASRRLASWCYQQLNRLLFRLDVRDTQVGLKLFSRRVVDEVMPLLMVKRFAFDLELLAVATALGHGRVRELPIRLDYRFTGSGVRSAAALRALWDTFAIFCRLRILQTYARKQRLVHGKQEFPLVSVVADASVAEQLDYPRLEAVERAESGEGELVAVLARGADPASNWVRAAVPFFGDPAVAAVVVPTVSPLRSNLRTRLAAAVLESRLGGGSRRTSFFPGNLRVVADHPAESVVIRRADYLAARSAAVDDEELVAWLTTRGKRTMYTPDTSLAVSPPPFVRPHLAATWRHAHARGAAARRSRGESLSAATALSLLPTAAALTGAALLLAGTLPSLGEGLVMAYGVVLAVSGIRAALRFRSPALGLLEPPAVVASQAVYLAGFVRGLLAPPRYRPSLRNASESSVAQSKRRA
jgi:glycosyltransferase involved in cell wall biosynthesis